MTMRPCRRWFSIWLILGLAAGLAEPEGWAAPLGAKQHAQRARELDKKGLLDEAIAEYQQAYDLSHDPILLFDIALEYRRKGDRQKAIDAFGRYVALVPNDATSDEARQAITELEKSPAEERRSVPAVESPPNPEVAPAAPPPSPTVASPENAAAPGPPIAAGDEAGNGGRSRRTLALVVGATGLASIAAGTVVVLMAKSDWDASRSGCDAHNVCSDAAFDQATSARTKATVSTVLFGAGLAAAATGAILWFTAPTTEPSKLARWRAMPSVSADGVRLVISGGF